MNGKIPKRIKQSEESRKQKEIAYKKLYIERVSDKERIHFKNNCVICKRDFAAKQKKAQTCGTECYRKRLSQTSRENPKCGGSTKQFIDYDGITLDSSWEVTVARSLDENHIRWERPTFFRLKDRRRYTPDFWLPEYNVFLDPKAYRPGYIKQCEKIRLFEKEFGKTCLVLSRTELSWQEILTKINALTPKTEI